MVLFWPLLVVAGSDGGEEPLPSCTVIASLAGVPWASLTGAVENWGSIECLSPCLRLSTGFRFQAL